MKTGRLRLKTCPEGTGNWPLAHVRKGFVITIRSQCYSAGAKVDTGFAVSSGTVLDVVVSPKGAEIDGTVVDGNGKPVARAMVGTAPSSGKLGRPDAYQEDQTNEDGRFVLRGMNPGAFVVLAFEEIRENYRTAEFVKKY